MKKCPRISKQKRVEIYIAMQMDPRYDRLSEDLREIIDCFAAGMGYVEIGKAYEMSRSNVWQILTKKILPRYDRNIWRKVDSLSEALQLVAFTTGKA